MTKVLAFIAVSLIAATASAEESTAPKKPSVCLSFQLAKSEAGVVAICHDGKKPALFTRFEVVEVPGESAGRVRVLVGWR